VKARSLTRALTSAPHRPESEADRLEVCAQGALLTAGSAFISSAFVRLLLARIRVRASSRKRDLLTFAVNPFRSDGHRESGGVELVENDEKSIADGVDPSQNRPSRQPEGVDPLPRSISPFA
jgi:hypothetical protein